MRVPNEPVDFVCTPLTNIHDCFGSDDAYKAMIACVVLRFMVFALSSTSILYRWWFNVSPGFFRRVQGYWVPKPVDLILAAGWCFDILRCFQFMFVLFDWPRNMAFREWLNMFAKVFSFFTVALFVAGIISHIPPVFVRRVRSEEAEVDVTGNNKRSSVVETKQTYTMYVPSTGMLYWTSIVFCIQMFAVNVSLGIWAGWVLDSGMRDWAQPAYLIEGLVMDLSILVEIVVVGYYCHCFYRVMCAYADHPADEETAEEKRVAAGRFGYIFLGFFVALLTALLVTTLDAVLQQMNGNTIWKNLTTFLAEHVISIPLCQFAIYGSVLLSSLDRQKRATSMPRDSRTGDEEPEFLKTTVFNKPTHTSAYASQMAAGELDQSLVWHSLAASRVQSEPEENAPSYSAPGMELTARNPKSYDHARSQPKAKEMFDARDNIPGTRSSTSLIEK